MSPLTVVGGCYRERVVDPWRSVLCGSGLRAAAVIEGLGHSAQLFTRLDEESTLEAQAIAATYGVNLTWWDRPTPIEFTYRTALARPSQTIPPKITAPITLTCDNCIAFGMTEGPWVIHAEKAVVDLQHSDLTSSGLTNSEIDHLALIVNAREAMSLTKSDDLNNAANDLIELSGAEVLIIKDGIRGARVFSEGSVGTVGVHPTPSVAPIGSGDAFSAGFAASWILDGKSAFAAAEFASRVTAAYCQSGDPVVRTSAVLEIGAPLISDSCRVYLAGPFFNSAERWLIDHVREALTSLGAEVFSPFHDVGFGGDEVAIADLAGLEECSAVLALVDYGDPGTLFEIGWARSVGMPVVAYTAIPDSALWTMLRGTDCLVTGSLPSAVYWAGWKAMTQRVQ